MKRITKIAIVMTIFAVVSALGQTRTQIEARFGQPVKSYAVSDKIWMSAEYASDGQVCRMKFYPRRFSATTNYLTKELPFNEFTSVIDSIVPVSIRGAQKEPFRNGLWDGGGGLRWTNFIYERVTISYVASAYISPEAFAMAEWVLLDREDSKEPEKPKPTKEDFSLYRTSTAEIVTVQWNDRQCVGTRNH